MALQTGGHRLTTMPEVNVDFRVKPIDLSGLGRGLSSGFQQMGQQKRERAEKKRQGDIRTAAFNAFQGDEKAISGLPEEDAILAEGMRQELEDKEFARKMKEEQAELQRKREKRAEAAEDRAEAAEERTVTELEREKEKDRIKNSIQLDNKGQMVPSRQVQMEDPVLLREALQEKQKDFLDIRERQSRLEASDRQARGSMQDAYAKIRAGQATEEQYANQPWSGMLNRKLSLEKPEDQFQVFMKNGVRWVEDVVSGEARILETTELERLMDQAGLDEKQKETTAKFVLAADVAKKTEGAKPKKEKRTPKTGVPMEFTDEEAVLFDEFNSGLSALEGTSWSRPGKNKLEKEEVERLRIAFGSAIQANSKEEIEAAVDYYLANPTKENRKLVDNIFGKDFSHIIDAAFGQRARKIQEAQAAEAEK